MRIKDLEYEPCGHTSHWTCIPPRPARKDVLYEKPAVYAKQGGAMIFILAALLAAIFFSHFAHAGWLKDFCAKHLVANDPFPYAEVKTEQLLTIYSINHDGTVREELEFRRDAWMLTQAEVRYFERLLDE